MSVMPRALASKVAAGSSSSMNPDTRNCSRFWTPLSETRLGKRPENQRLYSYKAAMEHRARAPADSNIPGLENVKRDDRGVGQVPQFMSQEPQPLTSARVFAIESGLVGDASVFGDRVGDGVVQAAVQRTKVLGADWRVHFDRQLGDSLADVTIVVHDLRHGKPLKEQVMPVPDCALPHLWIRRQAEAQRIHQLGEEHGYPVIDLRLGGQRQQPRGHLPSTPPDDLFSVDSNEFVEHLDTPRVRITLHGSSARKCPEQHRL